MTSLIFVVMIGLLGSVAAVQYKNVQCDSQNNKFKICDTGLNGNPPIVDVTVVKRDSRAPCVFDVDFGIQGAYVWVDNGCRALFNVAACERFTLLDCNSRKSAFNECSVSGARMVNHVILKSQRSNAACVYAASFGVTGSSIWVNNGCRGEFLACH